MAGSTIYIDDNPSYTGAYRRHKSSQPLCEAVWLNEGNCHIDTTDQMTEPTKIFGGKRIYHKELVK